MHAATPADPAAGARVRFMTVDPGHFHAALVHKQMYPRVSPQIDIYAPDGWDLDEHLRRLARFNERAEHPTHWRWSVHTGPDFFERMLRERPGNVVVLAGRNRRKIDYIEGALRAGLHVLADKPWIVRAEDLPRLEAALRHAAAEGLVACDILTERYEATNAIQRELVGDPAITGGVVAGTPDDPAVRMTSVHHILKTVAGQPLRRPAWFFDPREQGEALADVGTHLVDLSIWTLFPDTPLDHRSDLDHHSDVEVISASRWPTPLTLEQFRRVTGAPGFPASLAEWTRGEVLECSCNTRVAYTLRGTHVALDVLWDAEAPHGDTHEAVYRGEKARVEVRQGEAEAWRPEVYVVPETGALRAEVLRAVRARVETLRERWAGVGVEDLGERIKVTVPERLRLGHEHHFAEVTARFLELLERPGELVGWEMPSMLARYFVTTRGTELSHT